MYPVLQKTKDKEIIYVALVEVAPEFRGKRRGIGKALMLAMLERVLSEKEEVFLLKFGHILYQRAAYLWDA